MLVGGGFGNFNYSDETELISLDPVNPVPECLKRLTGKLPKKAFYTGGAMQPNGRRPFVCGGLPEDGTPFGDCFEYDADASAWIPTAGSVSALAVKSEEPDSYPNQLPTSSFHKSRGLVATGFDGGNDTVVEATTDGQSVNAYLVSKLKYLSAYFLNGS